MKRGLAVFVGLVLVIGATSGFVFPNPPPGPAANGGQDLPDPAITSMRMLDTNPSASWLFASQSPANTQPIAALPFDIVGDAKTGNEFNALDLNSESGQAPAVVSADAPTMEYLDGAWVMWFTGYTGMGTSPNCLYGAKDSGVVGMSAFEVVVKTCGALGLFDPSLWINPDGTVWLLYAQENPNMPSQNVIQSEQLTANGLSFAGGPIYTLASQTDIAEQTYGYSPGSNPQVENPAFAIDPTGGFDLLVSYGTYNAVASYGTLEVSCASITGPCNDTNAQHLDFTGSGNPGNVNNTAGASVSAEGLYDASRLPFAAAAVNSFSPRSTYVETDNSPQYPEVGSPVLTGGTTLTGGQSVTNPVNGYQLIMQTDGNLVLYAPGGVARFTTQTNNNPGARAVMQTDGNFVVYSTSNVPLYNTHTQNNPGAFFILQEDDNGVLKSQSGQVLFSTNTCLNC